MSFAHAALFVICANIADNAAPDDPFAPDGPVAREMKRMQEAASFSASRPIHLPQQPLLGSTQKTSIFWIWSTN